MWREREGENERERERKREIERESLKRGAHEGRQDNEWKMLI